MKLIRRIIVIVVVLAAVAAIAWSLWPRPALVEVAQVVRADLTVTVDEIGRTRVKDRFIVSSPLAGVLARVELQAGASVEAGAVIARVLPARSPLLDARTRDEISSRLGMAQAARAQAQATLERSRIAEAFAENELASIQDLARSGAVPQRDAARLEFERESRKKERDSAQFAAHAAAHEVKMLERMLRQTDTPKRRDEEMVITSPLGGRVLRILKKDEGVVAPGQPIIELGDPLALEVVVDVLTSDAVHIQPGAAVVVDSWGGGALNGQVRLVEPSATTRMSALGVEEQRVAVVIDPVAPREAWNRLGDGWRVEVRITIWTGSEVTQVPSSALFRRGEDWAVFALEDGRARLRVVSPGQRAGRFTQIVSGVSAGQTVILHPPDRVRDGTRAQPLRQ